MKGRSNRNVVLFLDDEVVEVPGEAGVLPAGRNRLEEHFEFFVEREIEAMLFDGRVLEVAVGEDELIRELVEPAECADEIMHRLRSHCRPIALGQLEPNIVLDVEWFGDMEYGQELLHELFRLLPTGRANRVIVCSKYADTGMRNTFAQRFEIAHCKTLDKSMVSPEVLWKAMFDDDPPEATVAV